MDPSLSVPQSIRALTLAVENGDTAKVQMYLDQNISVETTDADGNSLMHTAAANGHEGIVRMLCIRGAALDRTNTYGWTPLLQAARYGHEDVALHLLNNKANINATTTMGITALTLATYGGHSKMVDLLLSNGFAVDESDKVSHYSTPLAVATLHGKDDLLRTLLKKGIPPDQHFKFTGWTPLMIAAITGQVPMARLLVEKGANTNLKNKIGKTALELATDCGMKEVRGYLDRKTTEKPERVAEKGDNIITAVKSGIYAKVSTILKQDPSQANKSSSDGATPLMYASIAGHVFIIKLLIENGADIDATDYENGWTALMQATYYGKTQAAIALIKFGADVRIPAHNGVTAFDMAMLINLNDTTLFRMLAEKVMQGKQEETETNHDDSTQLTKAWQSGSASRLTDLHSQVSKSTQGLSQAGGSKHNWWSKVSRTVRGMKLPRPFKPVNKVLNFEDTLIAPGDPEKHEKFDPNSTGNVTITEPNHLAPATHFPMDKLSPVIPPFQTSTGVDKQTVSSQRKISSSKTSMSNSLNSSGESSASRSVVRPSKFLYSPNNSGRYNSGAGGNTHSPHSSGGATSATQSFSLGHNRHPSSGLNEPHNTSGDRHSDTVLTKIAKRRQRKYASTPGSMDNVQARSTVSADQLVFAAKQAIQASGKHHPRRTSSRAESVASSQSTNSTLTPTHSPRSMRRSEKSDASSRSRRSSKKPSHTHNFPQLSLDEEDELSGILQRLSLEKYQPIFEEQEIDMDAFLTLTHGDLSELGITQELPRQQILQAISQVKDNKQKIGGSIFIGSEQRSTSSHSGSNSNKPTTAWTYNSLPNISS
uniref:Ankyrin repeat and SAM domain-containing protein 6-like n=1 Tax=Phallusia mammillata TaxID=59560 RepID=A0A6F9D704_9ASCI|nr:ankyrin repeat and SAM domain-containing protein 6-like [Phallusia mammillata]